MPHNRGPSTVGRTINTIPLSRHGRNPQRLKTHPAAILGNLPEKPASRIAPELFSAGGPIDSMDGKRQKDSPARFRGKGKAPPCVNRGRRTAKVFRHARYSAPARTGGAARGTFSASRWPVDRRKQTQNSRPKSGASRSRLRNGGSSRLARRSGFVSRLAGHLPRNRGSG